MSGNDITMAHKTIDIDVFFVFNSNSLLEKSNKIQSITNFPKCSVGFHEKEEF